MGSFIQLLNNQSIDVFLIFHHVSVEMYEIFIEHLVSGHSAKCSSIVSEHKKLKMLLVCILIDIVHAILLTFPPFHI